MTPNSNYPYGVNPVTRGLNNLWENLTNSTNPTYIQPVYQPPVQHVAQPVFKAPPPIDIRPLPPAKIYPLPTTIYTPAPLRTHFTPLNPSYNNTYYGHK